ncbi:MAG: NAD(P)H-dependent oxidoreductase subunit E [Firmicutes bacterium]|nr:NAD(P)H-dependent oxidoreductase subunit E [Bacillota bacterium]
MSEETKNAPVLETTDEAEEERQKLAAIAEVIDTYKDQPGSLIKVLHAAQNIYGYLPLSLQKVIATGMNMPLSTISGVISFYAFFSTTPKADNTIKVCLGTACYVRGGQKIMDRLQNILGIKPGELTEDRKFSIEVTRCLGACGLAPVIMVNDDVHQQVNPDKLEKLLAAY